MSGFTLGHGVTVDLDALINTRLLVQANSGAGKSWTLRRILEQSHGAVQHLVLDPEGEFASLREHYDYILAARGGGDTVAAPRSAKLLAERLLELGVSAILDIYELKHPERIRFVRLFLEALVNAPKALWHPVLVVLDEAHVFAPQQGEAESAGAVIDLATRGRKRGFCLVPATQRLSKLHKDVAAECNNKLIGRSALDVDMKRAADELGFTTQEQRLALRELPAGTFYAFGPALSSVVTRVVVGPVRTSHPKAGARLAAVVPPPTAKVRAVLSKLADLPAEAEAHEQTLAELRAEVATLRRAATRTPTPPAPIRIEVPVIPPALIAARTTISEQLRQAMRAIETSLTTIAGVARSPAPVGQGARIRGRAPATPQRILDVIAMLDMREVPRSKRAIAAWLGLHPNGGRFLSNLRQLRVAGWIDDALDLTPEGARLARPLATGLEAALQTLDAPQATILRTLGDLVDGERVTVRELADALGLHPNGGRFRTNLRQLVTMGLVTTHGGHALTRAATR